MSLDENWEPQLASKNGPNVSRVYTRFFIFLSAWEAFVPMAYSEQGIPAQKQNK